MGSLKPFREVSFEVKEGDILSFIGANGAGISNIFKTVSGLIRPTQGEIVFEGPHYSNSHSESNHRKPFLSSSRRQTHLHRNSLFRKSGDVNLFKKRQKGGRKIFSTKVSSVSNFKRTEYSKDSYSFWKGTTNGIHEKSCDDPRNRKALRRAFSGVRRTNLTEIFHISEEINGSVSSVLLISHNAQKTKPLMHSQYVAEPGNVFQTDAGITRPAFLSTKEMAVFSQLYELVEASTCL
uniref:ABC transporter, ATP-binding protein n=1 Tax=Vibrio coralliilyticus TaxID=190893 RepID=M1FVT4_9VIBR|nr:ABC transporter, ATP-binding protein [Vibrio coralliilyticus]